MDPVKVEPVSEIVKLFKKQSKDGPVLKEEILKFLEEKPTLFNTQELTNLTFQFCVGLKNVLEKESDNELDIDNIYGFFGALSLVDKSLAFRMLEGFDLKIFEDNLSIDIFDNLINK